MVYRSLNALAPDYLQNIFQKVSETTNRQLRNSKTDVRLPLLRASIGQKSFAYRGAKVWSDLNSIVKASSSLCSFRRKYIKQKFDSSHLYSFFLQMIIVNRVIIYKLYLSSNFVLAWLPVKLYI